ncbi:hypothetical protein NDU88_003899 [Pleurodeles waltl]|uniref:Uncharacterized protein n=1 Tax=Pleurodeles waltl TaxID=8319 RepID=A0AAV7PDG9_PLEWA|nr:hypothetical protein NDU88_003899 [Pleurodeles waltl]
MWRDHWRWPQWRRCLRHSLGSSAGGWLSEHAVGGGVLGSGAGGWLSERAAAGGVLGGGAGGWLSERAAGGGVLGGGVLGGGAGGLLSERAAGGGVLGGGAGGGLSERAAGGGVLGSGAGGWLSERAAAGGVLGSGARGGGACGSTGGCLVRRAAPIQLRTCHRQDPEHQGAHDATGTPPTLGGHPQLGFRRLLAPAPKILPSFTAVGVPSVVDPQGPGFLGYGTPNILLLVGADLEE